MLDGIAEGCRRGREPGPREVIAEKVEAARDPPDKGLVRMLGEPKPVEHRVDQTDRPTQLSAGRRQDQDQDIVHEAHREHPGLFEQCIQLMEEEGADQRAQRAAERDASG